MKLIVIKQTAKECEIVNLSNVTKVCAYDVEKRISFRYSDGSFEPFTFDELDKYYSALHKILRFTNE